MTYSIESFLCELDYSIVEEEYYYAIESGSGERIINAIESLISRVLMTISKLFAKIRGIKEIYVHKDMLYEFNSVAAAIDNSDNVSFKRLDSLYAERDRSQFLRVESEQKVTFSWLDSFLKSYTNKLKKLKSELKNKSVEECETIKNKVSNYNRLIAYFSRMITQGINNYSDDTSRRGKKLRRYKFSDDNDDIIDVPPSDIKEVD